MDLWYKKGVSDVFGEKKIERQTRKPCPDFASDADPFLKHEDFTGHSRQPVLNTAGLV